MSTSQIDINYLDNEVILIATQGTFSSTLAHLKSGYAKPTNATIYPNAVLPSGSYNLMVIGVNWGGPGSVKVTLTNNGTPQVVEFQMSGVTTQSETIPITV